MKWTTPRHAPAGVELARDGAGVPQIRAASLEGLHWGLGYSHARDRGIQMCLMRILGRGRASECLDASDEMLDVDRFFRRMNWAGHMAEQVAALEPATERLARAYCDGVNARLLRRRPWELRLLGLKPGPWTIEDVLLMTRVTGYVTLAQSQAEVERLFVEMVQAGVSDDRLEALFPGSMTRLDRAAVERVTLRERIVPEALKWLAAVPRAMASNNWVVSAARTASGAAMLANDPHLEVNRLPNVWCEQALAWPDGYALGMTMPGLPALLVGRSEHLAWGATYTFMDAVDSWIEECRGGRRRSGDRFVAFDVRTEQVRRKGKDVDGLLQERPDGDPQVVDDLPDEHGVPLSLLGDAHDVLTGSDTDGHLFSSDPESTCNDWTSAEAIGKDLLRCGHSFPRESGGGGGGGGGGGPGGGGSNGQHWISDHKLPGCTPGYIIEQLGPAPDGSTCVGCAGGYGAIYCFATTP